jgi:hypothetical protein
MSFNCLITIQGQAKIAAAVAAGTQVSVTHVAVGDGNGNPTIPGEGQLSLVREVYRTNISSIIVNPANNSQVIFEGVIPSTTGGWTARELGLFDNTNTLIAVANIGDVYKPTIAEGSTREMVVRIILQVNQVNGINLVIDPSFYVATRSWVESNFSVAALLPGGTTGQILRKLSNADGDTEWTDPFTAQNITVNVVEETQTLASGQTVVNLATATTAGVAVYVEGIRLRPSQLTIDSAIRFTLAQSYPAGSKLVAVQNDPSAALDYLRGVNNLSEIPNKAIARTNLGLGSAAVKPETDFTPANTAVPIAGGTMSGPLILSDNPSADLQAANKSYVDSVERYSSYAQNTDEVIGNGAWTAKVLWADTQVVGFRQVEFKFGIFVFGCNNGDNSGGMWWKFEVLAKADDETNEHIIASSYAYSGGRPFSYRAYTPQSFLTPSNVDLTNKKLSIRVSCWGQWGGDYFVYYSKVYGSQGMVSIKKVLSAAPIPTGYSSVTQVANGIIGSCNTTFPDGAGYRSLICVGGQQW